MYERGEVIHSINPESLSILINKTGLSDSYYALKM